MSHGIPITDPVELAWMGFAVETREQQVSIASFKAGAKRQSARVRGELLAELEPEICLHRIPGSQVEVECVMVRALRNTLDRICPEEG